MNEPYKSALSTASAWNQRVSDSRTGMTSEQVPGFEERSAEIESMEKRLIWGTDFSSMRLDSVNFEQSSLRACRFNKATLINVSFAKCVMYGIDFTGSQLHNVNFTGARLYACSFEDCVINHIALGGAEICNETIRSFKLPPHFAWTKVTQNAVNSLASEIFGWYRRPIGKVKLALIGIFDRVKNPIKAK
jgi:uncharacterized protein YjbI with pentapeptide repeats